MSTRRLVCKFLQEVEDEQHILFDCPAYSHIRAKHAACRPEVYFSKHLQCQTSLLGVNQMHVEVFSWNVFF